jgi:outer membrane protein OmpA-like peptidoglycan-associated protein
MLTTPAAGRAASVGSYEDVYFERYSERVSGDGWSVLRGQWALLLENPEDFDVTIGCHSDEEGDAEWMRALSARRAEAWHGEQVALGVEREGLVTRGPRGHDSGRR